jgi:hypothetical protein
MDGLEEEIDSELLSEPESVAMDWRAGVERFILAKIVSWELVV